LLQLERTKDQSHESTNADLQGESLTSVMKFDDAAAGYLETAAEKLDLTARGFHRIMRVARTIADLDSSESTQKHHISEAISFRLVKDDIV
jgi:magnesium chelatase family protein